MVEELSSLYRKSRITVWVVLKSIYLYETIYLLTYKILYENKDLFYLLDVIFENSLEILYRNKTTSLIYTTIISMVKVLVLKLC